MTEKLASSDGRRMCVFLVSTVKGWKPRVLRSPGSQHLLPVRGDSAERSTKGEGRDALHLLQDGLLGKEMSATVQRGFVRGRERHILPVLKAVSKGGGGGCLLGQCPLPPRPLKPETAQHIKGSQHHRTSQGKSSYSKSSSSPFF